MDWRIKYSSNVPLLIVIYPYDPVDGPNIFYLFLSSSFIT